MSVRSVQQRKAGVLLFLCLLCLGWSTAAVAKDPARAWAEVVKAAKTTDSFARVKHLENAQGADDEFAPLWFAQGQAGRGPGSTTTRKPSEYMARQGHAVPMAHGSGRPATHLRHEQNHCGVLHRQQCDATIKPSAYWPRWLPRNKEAILVCASQALGDVYYQKGDLDKAKPFGIQAVRWT